jgi:hypothetical protein
MADSSPLGDLFEKAKTAVAEFSSLLQEAYRRGRQDGADEMRENIIRAASAPMSDKQPHSPVESQDRAPLLRGSVRPVIKSVLRAHPGCTTAQAELHAVKIDPRISRFSVGGELRRNRGKHYRKNGRRWYLMANAERETAEPPTKEISAAPIHNQGGSDGTALAH